MQFLLFAMPNMAHTTQYILLSTFSCLRFITKVLNKISMDNYCYTTKKNLNPDFYFRAILMLNMFTFDLYKKILQNNL